ncbi:MAG: lysylphosphatidylglycerol synthase transmembrane domain-containing protein [Sandaracinaceae bacterium]
MSSAPHTPRPTGRRWLGTALRIGGTAAAFAWIGWTTDLREVVPAMGRVSAAAFVAAMAVTLLNLGVGAVRWRALLAAYGAPHRPPLGRLFHVYVVGFFYNNYLPGGVGGDVVRGVVTRESFGEGGVTASMTVVLVERVLGLAGLLLLVAGTSAVRPLPVATAPGVAPLALPSVGVLSALGLALALGAVAAVALGARLADRLPGALGGLGRRLPVLRRPGPFLFAVALSLLTHTLVAVTGWLMLRVFAPTVALADALVVVPLAMAMTYIPLGIGGLGWREKAFEVLCATFLGMARPDAVAASLLVWITQMAVAGRGGLLQLVVPAGRPAPERPAP